MLWDLEADVLTGHIGFVERRDPIAGGDVGFAVGTKGCRRRHQGLTLIGVTFTIAILAAIVNTCGVARGKFNRSERSSNASQPASVNISHVGVAPFLGVAAAIHEFDAWGI